jgi:hypothetical protein
MQTKVDDLDLPVWGAADIARVLNLLDEDGEPDLRRTFYFLERGYADADKRGRAWVSTRRRLLAGITSARQSQPNAA